MTQISVFDLDRTLTRQPTYSSFLLYAAWNMARWRLSLVPLLAPFAVLFALRLLSRRRMKEIMHRALLGRRVAREDMDRIVHRYAHRLVSRGIYPQARERISSELAQGRRIIIATAAPLYYAQAVAKLHAATDVVATASAWDEDALTPGISGENCYGPAKRNMLAAHLTRQGIDPARAHIRFYTDDISDRPTLSWCDEPIAVNPSPKLRATAGVNGWEILDWRDAWPSRAMLRRLHWALRLAFSPQRFLSSGAPRDTAV